MTESKNAQNSSNLSVKERVDNLSTAEKVLGESAKFLNGYVSDVFSISGFSDECPYPRRIIVLKGEAITDDYSKRDAYLFVEVKKEQFDEATGKQLDKPLIEQYFFYRDDGKPAEQQRKPVKSSGSSKNEASEEDLERLLKIIKQANKRKLITSVEDLLSDF